MRCSRARAAIAMRSAGSLPGAEAAALDRHLMRCAGCAGEARFEASLAADLASLRGPAPFHVDVSARVLERIASVPPPRRHEVLPAELGFGLAAAVLAGVGLLVAAMARWKEWIALLGAGLDALGRLAGLLGDGIARCATACAPALRVVSALVDAAVATGSLLTPLEPVARGAILGLVMFAATFTTWTVGRDLRARAPERGARGVRP